MGLFPLKIETVMSHMSHTEILGSLMKILSGVRSSMKKEPGLLLSLAQ